jgi:malonate decarboxylase alpha subunit
MQLVSSWMHSPQLPREKLVEALEALIVPGDRIVLEGDNQKQADFLACSLASVDPKKLHHLHLIMSSISRPEHSLYSNWESQKRSTSPPHLKASGWRSYPTST